MRLVHRLFESRRPARVYVGLEFSYVEDAVDKLHAQLSEDAVFLEESYILVDVCIRRRNVIDIDLKERLFGRVHDEGDVIVGAAEYCAALAGFKCNFDEISAVVEVYGLFVHGAVFGIGDKRHRFLFVHDAAVMVQFHGVYLISFFRVPDKVACTEVDLLAVGHLVGNADLFGKFREYHRYGPYLRNCACDTVVILYVILYAIINVDN